MIFLSLIVMNKITLTAYKNQVVKATNERMYLCSGQGDDDTFRTIRVQK